MINITFCSICFELIFYCCAFTEVYVELAFRDCIKKLCRSSPESTRGSQVFCLKGGNAVGSHLLGTPRLTIEEALLKPGEHLQK